MSGLRCPDKLLNGKADGSGLLSSVVDVVEALDLSEVVRQYAGQGSDAHHPGTLLGLLVYGYATGCRAPE